MVGSKAGAFLISTAYRLGKLDDESRLADFAWAPRPSGVVKAAAPRRDNPPSLNASRRLRVMEMRLLDGGGARPRDYDLRVQSLREPHQQNVKRLRVAPVIARDIGPIRSLRSGLAAGPALPRGAETPPHRGTR